MQTNPEQWAVELERVVSDGRSSTRSALTIQAAFAEQNTRNLSDIQRLVWKDEMAGICETLESCFDHGGPVRCGPCAIKASLANGVEPDYTLPNLPEVSRLKRENARLVGALRNLENANDRACGARPQKVYDAMIAAGMTDALIELDDARREVRATLAALKDRTHG